MIVTNDFVLLNFPKTGSSFVRQAVKQVYSQPQSRVSSLLTRLGIRQPELVELMMPKIDEEFDYGIVDQHGTYRQIPQAHKNKLILSITRNPFTRYVSDYQFQWWKKYPPTKVEVLKADYPQFPDLSFEDYYQMMHRYGRANRLRGIRPGIDIGLHTIRFIQFYFQEPESILAEITEHYIESEAYKKDMAKVHFLHQENLSVELKLFLVSLGFERSKVNFLNEAKPVNVTKRTTDRDIDKYYSEALVEKILLRDKLLFALFPEYLPVKQPF